MVLKYYLPKSLILIFLKFNSEPCPKKPICPLFLFNPGWSLPSAVPFLVASLIFPFTITTPFKVIFISSPLTITYCEFHCPNGFKAPLFEAIIPYTEPWY